MGSVRDMILGNPAAWLAIGGLVVGIAFGYIVFRTNFCTMGSISDIVTFGDYRRFRSWLLAGAVAIAGAQSLDAAGVVAISKSMYLGTGFNWVGNIVGGLMFGFGMVFAGGCASRNLARVGAGDLRSLMTLIVMGLFAYMTIGGLLGPIRANIEQITTINLASLQLGNQGLGVMAASAMGLAPTVASMVVAAAIVAAILVYCFKDASFRASAIHIVAGVGIGLCVVAGWALTGLAYDELAVRPTSPISLTYVRPTADAIEWLQRFTAGMVPGFGVATVFGAIIGSFIAAVSMGRFQLTTFADVADTRRGLFGAALMGVGGVLALGCTIGQGITGISTLALGSFITFAAIVYGGVLGMKRMEAILMAEV
jgi:uncharacterized membrane protein YedE/YeeE